MKPGFSHGLGVILISILIVWGASCNRRHFEAQRMAYAEKQWCLEKIKHHQVIDTRYEWDEWGGCLLVEVEAGELAREAQ